MKQKKIAFIKISILNIENPTIQIDNILVNISANFQSNSPEVNAQRIFFISKIKFFWKNNFLIVRFRL